MFDYSIYFNEDHETFRDTVRRFAEERLRPHAEEWEEMYDYPRELFKEFAEMGFLGIRFPEKYGGTDLDYWYTCILCEELMRSGMVGLPVDMLAHSEFAIGVINDVGTEEQKQEFLAPAIAGEKIAGLGVTEPGYGSNVGGLKTVAKKSGGDYVINGSKTFITNGNIADFISLAVRTGGEGPGGLSLVILPTDVKGFSAGQSLKKIAARTSHTAELFFDDCKIPQRYLLGEEGSGFGYILDHFQGERLVVTFFVESMMQIDYEMAVQYAKERDVFGKPILKHQVWRHRLADVLTTILTSKLITYYALDRFVKTGNAHSEISIAKIFVTENAKKVAAECMQIFGGYGIMDEYEVSRIYKEVSGFTIGAGTSEIMREIVAHLSIDI